MVLSETPDWTQQQHLGLLGRDSKSSNCPFLLILQGGVALQTHGIVAMMQCIAAIMVLLKSHPTLLVWCKPGWVKNS
jgi:uncharacterized membrane protein